MSHLGFKNLYRDNLYANAFILGVSFIPVLYIAIGALNGFPSIVTSVLLPVYVLSLVSLIILRLRTQESWNWLLESIAQICCIAAALGFTALISNFNLQTSTERFQIIGLFATTSCVIWLIGLLILNKIRSK